MSTADQATTGQDAARFVLWLRDDRIVCSQVRWRKLPAELSVAGRRYRLAGTFYEHSHLLDDQRRLVGFELHDAGQFDAPLRASPFILKATNTYWDGYVLRVDLGGGNPMEHESDAACIVGPAIYHDGDAGFLFVIDDNNGLKGKEGTWPKFWSEVGFASVDSPVPDFH